MSVKSGQSAVLGDADECPFRDDHVKAAARRLTAVAFGQP
jgi:hypothetical protein